ncbi:APC family permease [Gordonia jinhuaensis]|uniref:APC family permease n=1 Tax=Gordonia jinhuaensis TaxID=1517702 RepID=UPI00166C2885|nr:APC family permease [Gordonia jinhuaensis]
MSASSARRDQPNRRGVFSLGARSDVAGLDRRSLRFADLTAQSVSVMAPCAAAATTPLLVAQSGASLLWSLLTAIVLSAIVSRCIAEFASRMSAPGSLYTYAAKGLGPAGGIAAAVALVLAYGVLGTFAATSAAWFLLGLMGIAQTLMSVGSATLVILAVAAVVLFRGIRLSARVSLVVEAVAVALVLVVLAVLTARIWNHIDFDAVVAAPTGVTGYLGGVAVATCALVGFESAASLSVEARRPLRTVPMAVRLSLYIGATVVLVAAVAQAAGFTAVHLDPASAGTTLADLMRAAGLGSVMPLLDVGIVASSVACLLASTTALARVLMSLGREGVLPRRFGDTHVRYKTPSFAIMIALVAMAVLALLVLACVSGVAAASGALVSGAAFGFLASYALVCAGAVAFLRRTGELRRSTAVVAVVGALTSTGVFIAFAAAVVGTSWALSIVVAAVWVVVSIGGYLLLRVRRPQALSRIGIHENPTRVDVWSGYLVGSGWGRSTEGGR